MAVTRSQARLFAQLINELEPEVKRAFMASVTDLQARVNWPQLLAELERGNIEGAVSALNISPAAWNEYSATMTEAYAKSGASTAAQIRATGMGDIGTRFNMSNPRANEWIRENVGESIVGFVEEQKETARTIIRQGYGRGDGARSIATDLAGRVTTRGGARQGGVLGLDGPRARRLSIVSEGMKTAEGVQGLVVKHADGTLSVGYKVNKATENRILAAYRKGEAVPESARLLSERQYKNALLLQRAETVAATETASAVMGARDEEWRQLAEDQGLNTSNITKTWRHRRGGQGRPDHIAMQGAVVRGLNATFHMPDGTLMLHPHDPAGGARHNINCACSATYELIREVA